MTGPGNIPDLVPDPDPSNVYFALNGFEYRGIAHLTAAAAELASETPLAATTAESIEVFQNGDVMWLVTAAEAEAPVRTTLIAVREDGQWHVKHSHRSPASSQPRPGNI